MTELQITWEVTEYCVTVYLHVQSSTLDAHDSGTYEVACCTIKSRHGLAVIGGIQRSSPWLESYHSWKTHNSRTCPKRLFSYVKWRTNSSDGIPPLLLGENPNIPAQSNLVGRVYSTGIVNNTYHNDTTDILAIGPVHLNEEAIRQLITNLRPI